MTQKLFVFRDNVDCSAECFAVGVSAPSVIRTYYPAMVNRKPLKDIEIYELGEIEDISINLYKKPVKHDWSEYKFPETRAEALAPLGLSPAEVQQIFDKKTADVKDKQ